MSERIVDELEGIDLGDERLNQRSKRILGALAVDPQVSINAACQGWAETLAAYRFFDNEAVTPQLILQPHRDATQRRMAEHKVVLIAQDTTELDFTKHPPTDARCLNTEVRFGLYEHLNLAVTPDNLPLGVVGLEFHDRDPEKLGQTSQRRTLPIEDKESFRWLTGYRLACELAAACPQTQVISLADREGDIYDIFVEAAQHTGPKAEYIIRAKEDRSTLEPHPDAGPAVYHKVRAEVAKSPVLVTRELTLQATPKRQARPAQLEIRALRVTVKPPHARRALLPAITHHVVLITEVNGPDDDTSLDWLLMTTLPIDTPADVEQIVDYYVSRWTIEVFFRTLKTGCRVEEIQLETNRRLKNCLALYHIIAWRVLSLTYLNRTNPTVPCTNAFEGCEWKSVWCVVRQQPLPPQPPNLSEFLQLLTELGGYNNRTTDPPAGPQPLWLGLRRMTDLATAWLTFGPETRGYV